MAIAESRTNCNKQIFVMLHYTTIAIKLTDDYCKSIQLQSLACGAHTQVKFKGARGYTR